MRVWKGITGGFVALRGEGAEDMFVRRKRKTSLASFHAEMVCLMSCFRGLHNTGL